MLGRSLEQALHKFRLPHHISSADPLKLSLPHHVHRLYPFDRSLRRVERAETLHCSPPPADESVILLHDIGQVFCPPQCAVLWYHFLLL